jgi:hypothetical protein
MTKIKALTFRNSEHLYGDREAIAVMEDGSEQFVFPWFRDELQFSKSELIGLTIEQARDLKQARDVAYLQS